MKSNVEARQNKVLEYIKSFYVRTGTYPTYREIANACGYVSLSLLSRDIDSLIAKGELIKNSHKKIQLKELAKEESEYFNFPLLFASRATKEKELLCEEDRTLLEAQETYLSGDYLKSIEMSNELLSRTKNINVKFGCLLTKCCCSLYTGNPQPWKETFLILLGFEPKTQREIMAKELCLYFLSTVLGVKQNCPKWLKEGRFYGLTEKALPLAKLTYVSTIISSRDKSISPYMLEPLCSEAVIEGIDLCQIYMDLYLSIAYHFYQNDEYLKDHLKSAIDKCVKNNWLTPLVEIKSSLGTVIDDALINYDEEYIKKIDSLQKVLKEGFTKIYSAIIGDNPTTRLTYREGEIANYVRLGLSNKEIASKLCLSTETVKYYLSSIYSKIHISGRKELRDLMMKN